MRAGVALLATLVLVSTTVTLQVSAGDIYWEGEEDASNEFLEVKEEPLGVVGHLKRLKRGWFDIFAPSSPEPEKPSELTVTDLEKDDAPIDDADDNENDLGSGFPDRGDTEAEPREKTLRVTFVVHQPYQAEYNKRDSYEFKSFSKSLADAVNQLYEKLPGTQRATLVRIQSRLANEFTCKVTLDIVTTGYDDTNRIADILQDHIRNTRALGSHAVNDADFNAVLIDPGSSLAVCAADEMTCDDGGCRESSARCNGVPDCDDGSDEAGCPVVTEAGNYCTDDGE
ncbi:low-density lipoprotein receptor domain class A domain-containing protein [Phthorimaea operculella]|nr:low-density lipoprotein receptor domain class A domain-containing protein [Phthorimaea operculella]